MQNKQQTSHDKQWLLWTNQRTALLSAPADIKIVNETFPVLDTLKQSARHLGLKIYQDKGSVLNKIKTYFLRRDYFN